MKRNLIRWLPAVLAPALVATTVLGFSVSANAAVKAGAKCSMQGKVKDSKGAQFTCFKSGKKLVWKKSKKNKVSQLSPTPSTKTTSKAAAALFMPLPPEIATPVNWGNLLSRSNEIPSIVYQDVKKVVARNRAAGNYKVPYDIYRGPNLNSENYADLDSWLDDLFAFSARVYKPDKEIFLLFPYEDVDWAINKLSDSEINHPLYADVIRGANQDPSEQGSRQNTVPRNPKGSYTGIWSLGATLRPSAGTPTKLLSEKAMVNHEYAHQVQQAQWFKDDLNGRFSGMSSNSPCWLVEGTPTLLELVLTHSSETAFKNNRAVRNIYLDQPLATPLGNKTAESARDLLIDTAYVEKWLEESSTTMPSCTQVPTYGLGYSLGYLAIEALSAISGAESGFGLFQRLADGQSWSKAFSDIYGISWELAKPILAQYIAENAVNLPR
ncbi:MAG: hypothetical protein QNL07_02855 [Candidatus Planktophila sp.]